MHPDAVKGMNRPIRGSIHLRYRFGILLVGASALVVMTVAFYASTARWLTRSRGEHLVWADAKDCIQLDLPAGASDVRYYQHLQPDVVIAADFAILESDFLAWAAQQGWTPKPIVGSITVWPRSGFGDRITLVKITDGLNYNTIRRGLPNRLSVTYDRGAGRAYFTFSEKPYDED